ncbi:MAG: PIG-L deacetylase family protein [bacterium]
MTQASPLRLMTVLAHPDDEALGIGGTLAMYAARGVETYVVTATRGERGRFFTNENRPSDAEVGRVREGELLAATRELGVREVTQLDYVDGTLEEADPQEAIGNIVAQLRRVRPQVVVTFDPFGAYGHADHIAISQLTTAAVHAAADCSFDRGTEPHSVSKLYYFVTTSVRWMAYQTAFKQMKIRVDGEERGATAWPALAVSAEIDTREYWKTAWRAVRRHESQMAVYEGLDDLTPAQHEALWGSGTFYRVFSRVNGGHARETDLFAGLG